LSKLGVVEEGELTFILALDGPLETVCGATEAVPINLGVYEL